MPREWYQVYQYDFNAPHGEVVVHKDHDVYVGDQIMLVSIDGDRYDSDYEGFGLIVKVVEIIPAHDPDYRRVRTDYRR